ncbi:MAG: hypothetical protein K9G24_05250 [Candidatus Nanopelagicales bacterium]|nr:hypothetical protein [Candidatus Nanopelagicales bacterium]MCF8542473.1 hypothetical protein [Candidatus Nanopelagicales bacterium]MCF8556847.1 hypothetical protein [Candidatus Nanopelagicales bacterium]
MRARAGVIALLITLIASGCASADRSMGLAGAQESAGAVTESVDPGATAVVPSDSPTPTDPPSSAGQTMSPQAPDQTEVLVDDHVVPVGPSARESPSQPELDAQRSRWSPYLLGANFSFATWVDGTICRYPSHDGCRR